MPKETETIVTRQPPTLNHRGLLTVGVVIAVAFVVTYAVMGYLYSLNRDEINHINRIENPTAKQFEQQLKAGVARCLKSPECRKLFPALRAQRSSGRGRSGSHNSKQGARLTRRGSHQTIAGRPRSLHAPKAKVPRKRRHPKRPQKRPHKKPPTPAPHPGQGGSPPPSGEPPPPLTIITKLPAPLPNPQVCLDHIARVNGC